MADEQVKDSGYSLEKFNEMKKNIKDEKYDTVSDEEQALMDKTLKEIYKKHYPEIEKDESLFTQIKVANAEVFFLRLCAMQEKMKTEFSYDVSPTGMNKKHKEDSTIHKDSPLKYPDVLTSASDMLTIYTDILVKKDQEFQSFIMSEDVEKIMAAYENPLYQNVNALVGNEKPLESVKDIEEIQKTNSSRMDTLNIIMDLSPEIQQMLGDMRADANIKYAATSLTSGYIHPKSKEAPSVLTERNREIAAIIDAKPKTVLALSILSEQRAALKLPTEKFSTAEDLQKRLEKPDVKDIAKRISYINRTDSLKTATKLAESYAMVERTSRGKDVHTA